MDHQQVDIVQAKPVERGVQAGDRAVLALVPAIELGGDEELFTADPGVPDPLANAGLVAVFGGGVDQPVADSDGTRRPCRQPAQSSSGQVPRPIAGMAAPVDRVNSVLAAVVVTIAMLPHPPLGSAAHRRLPLTGQLRPERSYFNQPRIFLSDSAAQAGSNSAQRTCLPAPARAHATGRW